MSSLAVNGGAGTAIFNGKANIQDITDPAKKARIRCEIARRPAGAVGVGRSARLSGRRILMRQSALACFAVILLVAPAARGQAAEVVAPPEAAVLAAELARLNATLSDIKALLERVTETQGLDLLMKRMELSSARVIEIEKRLRTAESERIGAEEERSRLELSMQSMLTELESGSMEASAEQLEVFTAHHEAEAARLRVRLRSLDEEIAVLRNDLDAKRRELDDWQTHIDRRLGGV